MGRITLEKWDDQVEVRRPRLSLSITLAELAPTLRGTGEHASFHGASEYVSITKCGYRIPYILRALIHMT